MMTIDYIGTSRVSIRRASDNSIEVSRLNYGSAAGTLMRFTEDEWIDLVKLIRVISDDS